GCAERAAELLASVPEWRSAQVLKCNPDARQLPVRARALAEGKTVYMAVPRLRDPKPFIELDPTRIRVPARRAASITGASSVGRSVPIGEVPHIDLVVCGSVAVNRLGARVGKGGGYSDLEFALLTEAGRIDARTVIATTAHPLQISEGELPEHAPHLRLDLLRPP